MGSTERFGDLRGMLHREPSFESFWALCRQFAASWSVDDAHACGAVHYACHYLERWPDAFRRVPDWEIDRLLSEGRTAVPMELFRVLDLGLHEIDAGQLETILPALHPGGLRTLDLSGCRLGPGGPRVLAARGAALLEQLEGLDLSRSGALGPNLGALSGKDLGRLRQLGLDGCFLQDDHLEALAPLEGLEALRLGENHLSDEGVRWLVRWPGLARLRTLTLRGNPLTSASAALLADCQAASGLEQLMIDLGQVGSDGARALAQSSHLTAAIRRQWTRQLERFGLDEDPYQLRDTES